MKHTISKTGALLPLAILIFLITACENPVSREEQAVCNHVDAEGLVVRDGVETLVTQWLGTVEGQLHISPGKTDYEFDVAFLTPDSLATVPGDACIDHSLRWIIEDTSIVEIHSAAGKWSMSVFGKRAGTTNIRFRAWHGDHADFTSLPIPVLVGDVDCEPVTVSGVQAVFNDNVIAEVNPSITKDTITIDEGTTLNPVHVKFTAPPVGEVVLPDSCANFNIAWEIGNSEILSAEKTLGQDQQIQLRGLQSGETTLRLILLHSDTSIYTSAPIDIIVSEVCRQFEADGFILDAPDSTIASQWIGDVSGTITLTESEETDTLTVSFLDFDSTVIVLPEACTDQHLDWIAGDSSLIEVVVLDGNPWRCVIKGKSAGDTYIRLRAVDGQQAMYTSLPIPVSITTTAGHEPIGATAAGLSYRCTMMASWNYDKENGANASIGYVVVEEGKNLTNVVAQWFDTLASEYGELIPLDASESGYSLGFTITDESIATAVPTTGNRWGLDISGISSGATTITIQLLYDGLPELETAPLNIMVRPEITPVSDSGSFMITKGGVWYVVARDGVLLSDSCSLIGPSEFSVGVGELSDLYSFWLPLNPGTCDRNEFSTSRYNLAFEFTESCIAKVVNHPIHWGEKRIFHLEGIKAGETGLKIHFIDRLTTQVVFTSPVIPVTVEP